MARIGHIGLGVMNWRMAGPTRKKGGHNLTVYNRTAAKAAAWVAEHGGASAPAPCEAARGGGRRDTPALINLLARD